MQKYLWVCLLHNTVISPVSGCLCYPSVRHLLIHQNIWLGQKIVHVQHLEKHWDKRYTICFVAVESDFLFSNTIITNIQKTLKSTNAYAMVKRTYIINKHQMIHNHICQSTTCYGCIQLECEFIKQNSKYINRKWLRNQPWIFLF